MGQKLATMENVHLPTYEVYIPIARQKQFP